MIDDLESEKILSYAYIDTHLNSKAIQRIPKESPSVLRQSDIVITQIHKYRFEI